MGEGVGWGGGGKEVGWGGGEGWREEVGGRGEGGRREGEGGEWRREELERHVVLVRRVKEGGGEKKVEWVD